MIIMIIYGTRGKVIKGELLKNIACDYCGNNSHLSFGVVRYFHVYWIPLFAYSKKIGLECLHCKRTLLDREIPQDVRQRITSKVFTTKNIFSAYIGLAILGGIFLLATVASIFS